MGLILEIVGVIALLFIVWFIILMILAYPQVKRDWEAEHEAPVPAIIPVYLKSHSDETVGTLNDQDIYRYFYTDTGECYEFDGIIDPVDFIKRNTGMTEILVNGKMIYKLVPESI